MIIKILHFPKDYINIIYLAGRNCYGLSCIHKDTSEQTKKSFVNKIVNNQHFSVLEHINITIFIKNASRSFLTQLTRHRLAAYSVKSQHFVLHKNFKHKLLENSSMKTEYKILMNQINTFYNLAIENGMERYIAREVLPNSTLTNIVMTANIREYIHIIKLRESSNNTPEIRKFAFILRKLYEQIIPEVFLYI